MTKNKFIRALKIICVLAPVVLGVFNLSVSYIGSAIAFSGITEPIGSHSFTHTATTFYEESYYYICGPIFTCIFALQGTSLGLPIYNMAEWTTTAFYGVDLPTLFEQIGETSFAFPIYLTLIIFWYLVVELVFFIPEVIILFIRWCKNLIYSFTRKGGFDA